MEFLFHTVVSFEGVSVYYNVYKVDEYYFFELLQNRQNVRKATDFSLEKVGEKWQCSIEMSEREVEVLVEEVTAKSLL